MSFDWNKYAGQISNAEPARIDRDYMSEGEHVIKVQDLVGVQSSQTGKDLVILEAEIIESETMKKGSLVKWIVALSQVPAWKVKENMEQIKSLIASALEMSNNSDITEEVVSSAVSENHLEGATLKCLVRERVSKAGKAYLDYVFLPCVVTESSDSSDDWENSDIPF